MSAASFSASPQQFVSTAFVPGSANAVRLLQQVDFLSITGNKQQSNAQQAELQKLATTCGVALFVQSVCKLPGVVRCVACVVIVTHATTFVNTLGRQIVGFQLEHF